MVELKQILSLKQSLQLVMTPQLQQAIKLLQLSRLELSETINREMLENPVLEEIAENGHIDESAILSGDKAVHDDEKITQGKVEASVKAEEREGYDEVNSIEWEKYLENYGSYIPSSEKEQFQSNTLPTLENILSKKTSLTDHLFWQLRFTDLSREDQLIGAQIILSLDSEGYLRPDDDDVLSGKSVTESLAITMDVSVEQVERVLRVIQNFDPVGVAGRSVKESLLIQARHQQIENGLVYAIIASHLHLVERKNFSAITRALDVSMQEVREAVQVIAGLEPKPGRLYTEETTQYITPDVYVYKMEDDYVIVLNEDGLPKLHLSPYYRKLLIQASQGGETRSYVQNKLRSALWLIRSIHQREQTIYRVTESIVKFQREFFDKGVAYLKPLVLKDVAEDVGLHESTVSRVTTNKYVYTSRGIYELKYFFNSRINQIDGKALASQSVKDKIRRIIARENPYKPLSDREIVDILEKQNISIARRTVAKYREGLRILSASNRKKMF